MSRSAAQKALSVELAIELERETFGQYCSRISIVSILVICFFVYPTVCQARLFPCRPNFRLVLCTLPSAFGQDRTTILSGSDFAGLLSSIAFSYGSKTGIHNLKWTPDCRRQC